MATSGMPMPAFSDSFLTVSTSQYWVVPSLPSITCAPVDHLAIGLEMSKEEVEAVLGHEIGHVANGDMVTLTLIQGVVNTFVIFLARVVGYVVDKAVFRSERIGIGFYVTVFVCEIIFGILASIIVAWFSRQREFRADAASAQLLGSPRPMVNALARLGGLQPGALPASFQSSGINNAPGWMALFSSHPPIEQRIEALQSRQSRAPGAV